MKGRAPGAQLTAAETAATAVQRPSDATAMTAVMLATAAAAAEGSGQRWWLDAAAGQSGADGRSNGAVGRQAQKISMEKGAILFGGGTRH